MTSRKRKARNWARNKERDIYARRARETGYRSRAVYKLQQIDDRDRLLGGARRILDLGAAPGGWSQYARAGTSGGVVIAVDLLPMDPIDGVTIIQDDFTDPVVQEQLVEMVSPDCYDLVLSDMAPNITGIVDVDQARSVDLAERVVTFSSRILAKNGTLLVKLFEGGEAAGVRRLGESSFRQCAVRKPAASRDKSREIYLLLRRPRG